MLRPAEAPHPQPNRLVAPARLTEPQTLTQTPPFNPRRKVGVKSIREYEETHLGAAEKLAQQRLDLSTQVRTKPGLGQG